MPANIIKLKMEIEMDIKYKIVPKFIFRDVENEGVVLLPETDTLYALSESAKIVWKEMMNNENSITYSQIVKLLSDNYDAELNVIKQDADSFVSKMLENKLFEVIKF